jgi:hypothetical protein
MDDFFAQPAWNMPEQLLNLKRQLRNLKLTERGEQFEFNAKAVVKLTASGDTIDAQLAKSPAMQPQWDRFAITNAPGMRKLVDEAKKRVQRWTEGQD